jgi:Phage-related tail fibre protein
MKTTSNLGLMKPEGTDVVDIENFNTNADTLDTTIGAMSTVPTTAKNIAGAIKEIHTAMSNLDTTISDGEITAAKLADSAVTNVKLAANAVTGAKMANGTVTATQLADGAVTSAKLADSGVSAGSYRSVTVDGKGRVTGGTNPTTLSGYGITDAAPLASPALTGTPTAPTAAADKNTTQLATTAFVIGQAGSTAPTMNGTVAAGSSLKYARADHVHPTDTTRAPLASPALTGTPTAPTAAVGTNTTQLSTTAFVIGQAGTATPNADGVATAGTSTKFAREDHVHPVDPDVNKEISSLRRELILMKQREDLREIQDRVDGATDLFYDMIGGNSASILKRDDTMATVASTMSSGATSATVAYLKGTSFMVGQEVTINDVVSSVKFERVRITGVNGTTVSFTAISNSFAAGAVIYRSVGVFNGNGGVSFGGFPKPTGVTVSGSTLITAANAMVGNRAGDKLVILNNGWLVAISMLGASPYTATMHVSKDGGATWAVVCTLSGLNLVQGPQSGNGGIVAVGNAVFWLTPPQDNRKMLLYRIDVATQANVDLANTIPVFRFTSNSGMTVAGISATDTKLIVAYAQSQPVAGYRMYYRQSRDLSGVYWEDEQAWGSGYVVYFNGSNQQLLPWITMRAVGSEVLLAYASYDGSSYNYSYLFTLNTETGESTYTSQQGGTGSSQYRGFSICHIQKNGPTAGRYWAAYCVGNYSTWNIYSQYSDDKGATWSVASAVTNGSFGAEQSGGFCEDASGNIYIPYNDSSSGLSFVKCPVGTTTFGTAIVIDSAFTDLTGVCFTLPYIPGTVTIPPVLYGAAASAYVKFKGTYTWANSIQPLTMDLRYAGDPSDNIDSIALWIQRDIDANFTVTPTASVHATNEAYSAMSASSTINIDGSTSETGYTYTTVTAQEKAAIRLAVTRSTTSNQSGIKAVFGGVGR